MSRPVRVGIHSQTTLVKPPQKNRSQIFTELSGSWNTVGGPVFHSESTASRLNSHRRGQIEIFCLYIVTRCLADSALKWRRFKTNTLSRDILLVESLPRTLPIALQIDTWRHCFGAPSMTHLFVFRWIMLHRNGAARLPGQKISVSIA